MPFFKFEASDPSGKTVGGSLQAGSPQELQQLLRSRGLFLTHLDGEPVGGAPAPTTAASIPTANPASTVNPAISTTPRPQIVFANSPATGAVSTKPQVDPSVQVTDYPSVSVVRQWFMFSQWSSLANSGFSSTQILHHSRGNLGIGGSATRGLSTEIGKFLLLLMTPTGILMMLGMWIYEMLAPKNRMLNEMESATAAGVALSEEMAKRPKQFSPYMAATTRIGELSGNLPEAYEKIAETVRRSIGYANLIFYLVNVVPFMAVAVGFSMMISKGARAALHLQITEAVKANPGESPAEFGKRILIEEMSKHTYLLWQGFLIGSIFSLIAVILLTTPMRKVRHFLGMLVPMAYPRARSEAIERVAWALSSMLRGGSSPAQAIHGAVQTIPNYFLRDRIAQRIGEVRENEPLATVLERSGLFSHMHLQLIHTGQVTGTPDRSLDQICQIESDNLKRLSGYLYWSIYILIAGGISVIVGRVIIALFQSYASGLTEMINSV